ncbi:MAG TPA: DUF5947 family protein [Solirubrobacteraceae bacterium]|jgi:hypothetical protein
MSERLADAVGTRRRAQAVTGLRTLARAPRGPARVPAAGTPSDERPSTGELELCDLCGTTIPPDHRHLLHLVERRIVCTCEACWGMRGGEGDFRPTGQRTLWLDGLDVPDDLWASFQIPIGLAFFMRSTVTECVIAMYPSPAGATESELHFESWNRMVALNSAVGRMEADIEGLIVNRLTDPPQYVIAPIDRCYELTGTIKAHWEGISGGRGVETAVAAFFDRLRGEAVPA